MILAILALTACTPSPAQSTPTRYRYANLQFKSLPDKWNSYPSVRARVNPDTAGGVAPHSPPDAATGPPRGRTMSRVSSVTPVRLASTGNRLGPDSPERSGSITPRPDDFNPGTPKNPASVLERPEKTSTTDPGTDTPPNRGGDSGSAGSLSSHSSSLAPITTGKSPTPVDPRALVATYSRAR
jgi:hypothetical protein